MLYSYMCVCASVHYVMGLGVARNYLCTSTNMKSLMHDIISSLYTMFIPLRQYSLLSLTILLSIRFQVEIDACALCRA